MYSSVLPNGGGEIEIIVRVKTSDRKNVIGINPGKETK